MHSRLPPSAPAPTNSWDYKRNISVPFIAMVFDQCTDPICDQTGYLDFDVYNELQPVFNGTSGADGGETTPPARSPDHASIQWLKSQDAHHTTYPQ